MNKSFLVASLVAAVALATCKKPEPQKPEAPPTAAKTPAPTPPTK